VGVIGFGSGLTTHTLLGDTRLEQVDTIEIEEAMVQGARFWLTGLRAPTPTRARSIVIDDAKAYFSGQQAQLRHHYFGTSNPWVSGVSALFSKEFYQFVPRHLNENGLFVQWVQLYETNDALVGSILKTLTPAFADYAAWASNSGDLLIVASPKGVKCQKLTSHGCSAARHCNRNWPPSASRRPKHCSSGKWPMPTMLRGLSKIHPKPARQLRFLSHAGPGGPQSAFQRPVGGVDHDAAVSPWRTAAPHWACAHH
jgi:spermidine synthase